MNPVRKIDAGQSGAGFLRPTFNTINFDGMEVGGTTAEMREYRQVQAVFQDPFSVYNPFYRVRHVFDMVVKNFGLTRDARQARDMMEQALNAVGSPATTCCASTAAFRRPASAHHDGTRLLAEAEADRCRRAVSMVDASLRASILDVMMKLRNESGISFLYITHDLSTAFQIGDKIVLFYQGTVAEEERDPGHLRAKHPYVQLLIDSVPARIRTTAGRAMSNCRPRRRCGPRRAGAGSIRAVRTAWTLSRRAAAALSGRPSGHGPPAICGTSLAEAAGRSAAGRDRDRCHALRFTQEKIAARLALIRPLAHRARVAIPPFRYKASADPRTCRRLSPDTRRRLDRDPPTAIGAPGRPTSS